MVVLGHEGAGLHPVYIQNAMQVIDLVLQNTCVPTGGVNRYRLALFVESFNMNSTRPWNDRGVAGHAQAPFEELGAFRGNDVQNRLIST